VAVEPQREMQCQCLASAARLFTNVVMMMC
jgi:hypothetical protein